MKIKQWIETHVWPFSQFTKYKEENEKLFTELTIKKRDLKVLSKEFSKILYSTSLYSNEELKRPIRIIVGQSPSIEKFDLAQPYRVKNDILIKTQVYTPIVVNIHDTVSIDQLSLLSDETKLDYIDYTCEYFVYEILERYKKDVRTQLIDIFSNIKDI